jgi:putative phosphoribosyl transferase
MIDRWNMKHNAVVHEEEAIIPVGKGGIVGNLGTPSDAKAMIIFAHGSGSGRFSPRNRAVAHTLQESHLATLLVDLLTEDEQRVDEMTAEFRFDIALLSTRLIAAMDWAAVQDQTASLRIGIFGASTGASAALMAAAARPEGVYAIVSRGGRTDLAADRISQVQAPVLMIVGGEDRIILDISQITAAALQVEHKIEVVPGATHLFEEPGALERAAELTVGWFVSHL